MTISREQSDFLCLAQLKGRRKDCVAGRKFCYAAVQQVKIFKTIVSDAGISQTFRAERETPEPQRPSRASNPNVDLNKKGGARR
jgi:hypothetical protein